MKQAHDPFVLAYLPLLLGLLTAAVTPPAAMTSSMWHASVQLVALMEPWSASPLRRRPAQRRRSATGGGDISPVASLHTGLQRPPTLRIESGLLGLVRSDH